MPYPSLDSLVVLPFLCVNWKFTFCLSDWHLPNFLSLLLLPFPASRIYLPLQILLSSHVSSFMKFLTDACTYSFNAGPCTPISVPFKDSFQKSIFQHSSQDRKQGERKRGRIQRDKYHSPWAIIVIFIEELSDIFYLLQYLINFKQRREINMRSRNSIIPVNTNKKPVEITKWVLDFILCLFMSSTSCSYFCIPAEIIKSSR